MADQMSKSVILVQENHSKVVSEHLYDQRKNGQFCDVILKVFGKEFFAHSNVLAAASPYFCSFFGQTLPRRFSQSCPQIVELQIEDCNRKTAYQDAILQIIDFVYTGVLHISANNIVQVLQLSRVLQMEKLCSLCSQHTVLLLNSPKPATDKMPGSNMYESASGSTNNVENMQPPLNTLDGLQNDESILELEPEPSVVESNREDVNSLSTQDQLKVESGSNMLQDATEIEKQDVENVLSEIATAKDSMLLKTEDENISSDEGDAMNIDEEVEEREHNNKVSGVLFSPKSSRILKCSECSYSTTKRYHLNRHMTCHTGGKYKCSGCDFTTKKLRELAAHKRVHKHMNNECSFCSFLAKNVQDMDEHLLKHKGDLPYYCDLCDKRFKSRAQLTLHVPKHSNEKPFVCEICGAGFKWKHALKGHNLVHTKEKSHLCDICGYATAHMSQLKAHKLIHTGDLFKCTHSGCSYQTIKKQNLVMHALTHKRERPHQCDVCGQAFSLVKNMKRHMLLHLTLPPHSCSQCSFTTTRKDKLNEHMNKTHGTGKPIQKRQFINSLILNESKKDVNPIESDKTLSTVVETEKQSMSILSVEYLTQLNSSEKQTQLLLPSEVTKLLQTSESGTPSYVTTMKLPASEASNIINQLEIHDKSVLQNLEVTGTLDVSNSASLGLVTLQPLQYVEIALPTSTG